MTIMDAMAECLAGMSHEDVSPAARRNIESCLTAALSASPAGVVKPWRLDMALTGYETVMDGSHEAILRFSSEDEFLFFIDAISKGRIMSAIEPASVGVEAPPPSSHVETLKQALTAAAQELDRISCVPNVTETNSVYDQFQLAKAYADRGAVTAWAVLRSPSPQPDVLGDAIRILQEGIDGAEADMQSDADAGERVDLFDYEISLPYETAREIAALLRAAPPTPNLSVWRDIKTAPVGKSVIICTWWKHSPPSAFRAEGYLDRDTKTWRNQDGSPISEDRTQPTHWMHIPEGPNATPSPQPNVRVYPQELTDDLRAILSMMMWSTGPIAHALRDGGQDIKRKAEEEQAEVMHWLIGLALEHGILWRQKASDRIREIRDALATTEGSTE